MKTLRNLFINKWLQITLIIVVLQQILVASGTFFLGQLTSVFPTEGFKPSLAIALFICIILPGTIVHYWVVWCTVRAYKSAQLHYLSEYMTINYNQPTHWRSEESKNQRHHIMCRGGQETILTALNFFIDFVATGLNILLNTISIILVTDFALGVAIVTSGFLGLWIIHLFDKGIVESSRNEMLSDNQLYSHLSRSWDNIILGNESFFKRWRNIFLKYFEISENASLQTVRKKDKAIAIAGLLTNGLVMGFSLGLAWMYKENAGFVLAIFVMLPRCLQIVMHIQIVQSYLAQWKNLKERLNVTDESLIKPKTIDLNSYISNDDISIWSQNKKHSIKDINQLINLKSGRLTITGQNGVGKSCFLLNLKTNLNSKAVYIPAQHQLVLKEAQLSLSSGETALMTLKDLQENSSFILLLDEWDANLSTENRDIVDKIIESLSQKKLIIEVRHFHQFQNE